MEIKPIRPLSKVDPVSLPDSRVQQRPARTIAPDGNWQFKNGHIFLNGQDIATLMSENAKQSTAFLLKLANDLDQYRLYRLSQRKTRRKKNSEANEIEEGELDQIEALVEAYIGKIMRMIKRRYDETSDGLSFHLDEEGQLTLNGMNITSFVLMARKYPSGKAKLFLEGLKKRLGVILTNKLNSPSYEKIRDVTLELFNTIDEELKKLGDGK